MTPRQEEVLRYIGRYIEENGWSPTLQEIADGIGLKSKSTAWRHIKALDKQGLTRHGDGPRTITPTEEGWASFTSDEKEAACESKSRRSSCRVRRSNKR